MPRVSNSQDQIGRIASLSEACIINHVPPEIWCSCFMWLDTPDRVQTTSVSGNMRSVVLSNPLLWATATVRNSLGLAWILRYSQLAPLRLAVRYFDREFNDLISPHVPRILSLDIKTPHIRQNAILELFTNAADLQIQSLLLRGLPRNEQTHPPDVTMYSDALSSVSTLRRVCLRAGAVLCAPRQCPQVTFLDIELGHDADGRSLFALMPNIVELRLLVWTRRLPQGPKPRSLKIFFIQVGTGDALRDYGAMVNEWAVRDSLVAATFIWPEYESYAPLMYLADRLCSPNWVLSVAQKHAGCSYVDIEGIDSEHPTLFIGNENGVSSLINYVMPFADHIPHLILDEATLVHLMSSSAVFRCTRELTITLLDLASWDDTSAGRRQRPPLEVLISRLQLIDVVKIPQLTALLVRLPEGLVAAAALQGSELQDAVDRLSKTLSRILTEHLHMEAPRLHTLTLQLPTSVVDLNEPDRCDLLELFRELADAVLLESSYESSYTSPVDEEHIPAMYI